MRVKAALAEPGGGQVSSWARWTIAIFSLVCTAGFVFAALTMPPDSMNLTGLWIAAAACVFIALACLPGPFQRVAARIVGAGIFIICVCYLASELRNPSQVPNHPGQANLRNAIKAFII